MSESISPATHYIVVASNFYQGDQVFLPFDLGTDRLRGSIPDPKFSRVTIQSGIVYNILFNDLNFFVTVGATSPFAIIAPEGVLVGYTSENGQLKTVTITLGTEVSPVAGVNPLLYNIGDVYNITVKSSIPGSTAAEGFAARKLAVFTGAGGGFSTLPISPTGSIDPTQPVRVPIIDIYGQTTLNGEYLSDMTFVIQDQYKYCKSKNIIDPCQCGCDIYYIQPYKLKTTTLIDNNIPLQDVVIGKGSLQNKVLNIFYSTGEPNFKLFYERFIRYSMLKYILIRLLYGSYDLSKLCRNYNKQFFRDLAHSRFCGFIEFFENPDNEIIGFEAYFIKCDQG